GFTHAEGLSGALHSAQVIYNLGADEIDIAPGAFVIYHGHHGDRGAHRADVILPGAAYTEQSGLYVNTEGRVQMGMRAGFPPGEAREDWAILRALSGVLGRTLPFDTLAALRTKLFEEHPHLACLDAIAEADWCPLQPAKLGTAVLRSTISDHYLTNPVARASKIMAELSRLAQARAATPLAAE
ncbi:MAG: molybdopterin-dependent oxidoreductase, partial [Pseudomonadota bacterium]